MESADAQRNRSRGFGQKPPSPANNNPFLNQQWWLGLKVGPNLTGVNILERASSFSAMDYDDSRNQKTYGSYNRLGIQAGLEMTYTFKSFGVGFQPNFRRQRFTYSTNYRWNDESGTNSLELTFDQDQALDYIELPVVFKYEYPISAWKPYLHFGIYYAILVSASKSVQINGIEQNSQGENRFEQESFTVGADDLFIRSSWGLLGGIGVNYDLGNIRVNMELAYRYGLNNITNVENRYTDNRLAGVGDALDDVQLRNIALNLGVLFPMRFLSKGFTAVN
jgi:outer membrane protein W